MLRISGKIARGNIQIRFFSSAPRQCSAAVFPLLHGPKSSARCVSVRNLAVNAATAEKAPVSSSKPSAAGQSQFRSNITPGLLEKVGRNLHLQRNHPLNILKRKIEQYFAQAFPAGEFRFFDNLPPKVTTVANFDQLLVPKGSYFSRFSWLCVTDHVSRRLSDTFYFDENTILRCHTSAHQTELMRQGNMAFLVIGDCYRRDEVCSVLFCCVCCVLCRSLLLLLLLQIDATHYPVFHQVEGVRVFPESVRFLPCFCLCAFVCSYQV